MIGAETFSIEERSALAIHSKAIEKFSCEQDFYGDLPFHPFSIWFAMQIYWTYSKDQDSKLATWTSWMMSNLTV